MKKYIFIIAMVFVTTKVYCQSNFPDSNAIWNVNFVNSFGTPTDEMLYGLKGDTLINDTLYNKLYTLSDTILSDKNLQNYIGGFRQEAQKIWFKPANWTDSDILLYDFSASIGDTIFHNARLFLYNDSEHTHEFSLFEKYNIVQDITVENGVTIYNLLEMNPYPDEWHSEFGSVLGLLGPILDYPLTGETYRLACFKHNDTVKYQNNLMCDECFCNGQTSLIEKKKDLDAVKVSSHSTESSFEITVNKPYGEIMIEVFDRKGRLIYRKKAIENPIKLPNRNPGLYFVKLQIDDEVIVKKIMKE
ncbi:MAG: T9SS type A sorting domain-containing protein [bacterium]